MSEHDIRIIDDELAHRDFEAERDQAVQLLADAAKRITELAQEVPPAPWVYCDNASLYSVKDPDDETGWLPIANRVLSEDAAWMVLASPTIAPFLAGWLSKVASIAAGQQSRENFDLYVDHKALGLATHVMGGA